MLMIVCLETLITGIRSLENENRKDASERMQGDTGKRVKKVEL